MRRALSLLFILAVPLHAEPPVVATTGPRTPADEKKAFHLPPGFEAQLVASEPDIHKPLNMNFDDRGRLWVTDTLEYPFPAKPGTKPRDTVKILEDFGPDGRARKITTFADGLNIPIGVVPLSGTRPQDAIVFSIPNIYRLRDSEGTGKADRRDLLYGEFGQKDTHGLTNSFTRGFDGWIYATHGYANDSTVRAGAGSTIKMHSGNSYRMKPDGSHIEQWTWGQVNPFGMTLDPLGNIYTADCHSQPIYQLLRGAYYPSFQKGHDGLGFAPEMYTNYRDSTAVCGITYYAADHFPKQFRDCAFVGDVVVNKINLFRIEWHGSTPKAKLERFLESDDPWFRPVDIKLGPDGALYVLDFYNRIIGHYEAPLDHPGRDRERGRIWRIVYKGTDGMPLATIHDWTTAPIKELIGNLGNPNLTVRLMVSQELVERGGKDGVERVQAALAAGLVAPNEKRDDRITHWLSHALWVLERQTALRDDSLAFACKDIAEPVRVHAERILGERAKWSPEMRALALAGLEDASPNVKRAAADALARHADPANLKPLLKLRRSVPADDTHLMHVVRMALRDQLRSSEVWKSVEFGSLSAEDARNLADVSLGVPSAETTPFLMWFLLQDVGGRPLQFRIVHHIARFGNDETAPAVHRFARGNRPDDLAWQAGLFKAIERGTQERGGKFDDADRKWADDLTGKLLASKNVADVQAGAEIVGSQRLEGRIDQLMKLATDRKSPDGLRNAAMTGLANLDAKKHAAILGAILADAESTIPVREHVAGLLAKANQPETLDQLVKALASAPARLQTPIAAGLAGSREGAANLLDAVAAGKASARLLQEKAVEVKLINSKLDKVRERLAKLTEGLPPADQKLQELIRARRDGFASAKPDLKKGALIFEQKCAICHQLGGKGMKIGPQLDGIGVRGLDRLLEDVIDPNRNVDQAFRLTTLNLKGGQVVSGLVLREEGAVLVLADSQGKEVRVEKAKIDERSTSQQSPMPADLVSQIGEADFHHLMAYLLEQRTR
jgi:putative membrane-bound dehydrogenase-like protein